MELIFIIIFTTKIRYLPMKKSLGKLNYPSIFLAADNEARIGILTVGKKLLTD